VDKTTQ